MLSRIASMAIAAPRRIVAVSGLILVAAAIFGLPVVRACRRAVFRLRTRSPRVPTGCWPTSSSRVVCRL